MAITQIKGSQVLDGTITSSDVEDSLEKEFTKVRVTTGDLTPDFLSNKIIAGSNITINTIGASGSVQYLAITGSGGSGSPAGSDTHIQFNDAGIFGGDSGLTYNKTTDALTLVGALSVGGASTLAAATASGAVSLASTLAVVGASTYANTSNSFNALAITGSLGAAITAGLTVGSTLGVTGASTLSGDLAVNGGDLTTTAATFNLLNEPATLNIGSTAVI